ncbi:hypothetical protein [Methylobrevis pamukkalensis]|uniref:Uncharacterized protein n=1 Tax=Methylobrevis pamukkalensis TaxID=1439726 RepID=A0A1E3GY35_9HYPH|nr:hypothetical protein [Methylobrevis pamukkalensis]ODN68989.1 hypothetical protein A6302_03713 [Methylobrevis pamukkalensis]
MFAELALYLLSAGHLAGHRNGRLEASVGLWSRGRRCRTAWAPHEAATKAAILQSVQRLQRRRSVAVLGSGVLRDVPLAELSAAFRSVVLVDVVHLLPARLAARRHGNVFCVTADLSGLTGLSEGHLDLVSPLAVLEAIDDLDLVVSVNLLSQLGLGMIRVVEAHPGADETEDLPAKVVGLHLAALRAVGRSVCLVTDTDCEVQNRSGMVVEQENLLRGHRLPAPADAWNWEVAPFGEEARDLRRVHRVEAHPFFSGW